MNFKMAKQVIRLMFLVSEGFRELYWYEVISNSEKNKINLTKNVSPTNIYEIVVDRANGFQKVYLYLVSFNDI